MRNALQAAGPVAQQAQAGQGAPVLQADGPAIAAWASAKLFEVAIERLGDAARAGPITTAMVLEGLGRIRTRPSAASRRRSRSRPGRPAPP